MIPIQIKRKMNTDALRQVEPLNVLLFEGEVNAHQFLIEPADGVSFAGAAVTAFFVRADNQRVDLTGAVTGEGEAAVTLGPNCYATPGRYRLTIFVTIGEETAAVYACCGSVQPTRGSEVAGDTEPIVEPVEVDFSGLVRFNEAQALTETEKAQARANIGAGEPADIDEGRNLLSGSYEPATWEWTEYHTQIATNPMTMYQHRLQGDSSAIPLTAKGKARLVAGQEMVLSFDICFGDGSNWSPSNTTLLCNVAGVPTSVSASMYSGNHATVPITVSAAQAASADSDRVLSFLYNRIAMNPMSSYYFVTADRVKITNIKLEVGDAETEWTLAPEDGKALVAKLIDLEIRVAALEA